MIKHGKKFAALGLALCLMLGGTVGLAQDMATGVVDGMMAQLQQAQSMTIDAQFALRQNGEDIITGEALCQMADSAQYASATIAHADGETRDMEMSAAEGTRTVRIGDAFYSMPVAEREEEDVDAARDAQDMQAAAPGSSAAYLNTVLEQLFGTAMERMTVTEDGIGLHLAGDEVPAILNLAVSMMGEHTMAAPDATAETGILYGTRGGGEQEAEPDETPAMTLGTGLHIDRIDLDVALEGGTLSGVQLSIVLMGVGEDDAALETELACVVRITDVDATEPATVDTTGVEMRPLEKSHRRSLRPANH